VYRAKGSKRRILRPGDRTHFRQPQEPNEVAGSCGLRLRWIIQEETSTSRSGTGIPARDGRSVELEAPQSRPGRPCHGFHRQRTFRRSDDSLKVQVSPAPATLLYSRAKLPEPWKPEAQARGWEHPEFPRLGCLPRLRPLRPPLRCPPTPRSRVRLPHVSHFWAIWRCEFRMKFQLSPTPRKRWPHSRKKLPATGDLCCFPALSSEPGLILLTAQVVRGSVEIGFVRLVVHPLAEPSEDRRRATCRRSDVATNRPGFKSGPAFKISFLLDLASRPLLILCRHRF